MEILLLLFLGFIIFVCLGILGWIAKAFGYILEFLAEGCLGGIGCLFWIIIIIALLVAL